MQHGLLPPTVADAEGVDPGDGQVPHHRRATLERIAVDGAGRAVDRAELGARVEGLSLEPAAVGGQERVVGRRLDRLALDPQDEDLGILVNQDVGDGAVGRCPGVGVGRGDPVAA